MLEKEIENNIENKSNNSSKSSSSKLIRKEKIFYHKLNELKLNNLNPENEIILNREKIIFLTFDIKIKSKFLETSENSKEKIKEFSENLKNFDIICLQNISSSFEDFNYSLIENASKNGFFFFSNSNSVDFFSSYFYENGQIILSRFLIEKFSFIPFENNIFNDSTEQKGILYSKIKIKNNFLNVINVNLQSNEFNKEKKNSNEILNLLKDCKKIRKNQILLIIKFLKEVLIENSENFKEGDLIILCGKFNNISNENNNEIDEIIELFKNNKINIKNVSGIKNVDFIFEINKENFESNFEIKCDFDNSNVKFEIGNENLNGISCEIFYKGKIDENENFNEKYNEKEELID